jgi:uncharacterized protein
MYNHSPASITQKSNPSIIPIVFMIGLAGTFWFVMFSPWTRTFGNLWLNMVCATAILLGVVVWIERSRLKELVTFKWEYVWVGILSAFVLYGLFYAGYQVALLFFSFATEQVGLVYQNKEQANVVIIGVLLVLWIGPAEEFFWRGFVQHQLTKRYGWLIAWCITAGIYALIHIWSFNLMLILAAGVCGIFWGALYAYYRSVIPGILSHAIWDILIFVILPIS